MKLSHFYGIKDLKQLRTPNKLNQTTNGLSYYILKALYSFNIIDLI
jgi:hypothetical protein